jgi:hypothetical protein
VVIGGVSGVSLILCGELLIHYRRMRVDETESSPIRLLCPLPSDNVPMSGKVSRVEGCEGLCVLCGSSV